MKRPTERDGEAAAGGQGDDASEPAPTRAPEKSESSPGRKESSPGREESDPVGTDQSELDWESGQSRAASGDDGRPVGPERTGESGTEATATDGGTGDDRSDAGSDGDTADEGSQEGASSVGDRIRSFLGV